MQITPFDVTTAAIYFAVPIVIVLVVMGRDLRTAIATVMLIYLLVGILSLYFFFIYIMLYAAFKLGATHGL